MARAVDRIVNAKDISVKDYHRILRDFCFSTKDYHVGLLFISTERATLPFSVKGINGRYFLSYINRELLSDDSFPFSVGDEIISFDDRPIAEVIEELRNTGERGAADDTDLAYAQLTLTRRYGMLGDVVPKGVVKMCIKTKSGQQRPYQIAWDYEPEKINIHPVHFGSKSQCSMGMSLAGSSMSWSSPNAVVRFLQNHTMQAPFYRYLRSQGLLCRGDPNMVGHREGFLPPLGHKLWESHDESPFHAYLFEMEKGRRVGYLRIPHYESEADDMEYFRDLITEFEASSDMLIIDQLNNPGGYILYTYVLASMLSDQPIILPKDQWKLDAGMIYVAIEALEELEEIHNDEQAKEYFGESVFTYPISYQFALAVKHFFQFLVDEWNKGKTLTDAYPFFGIDSLNPHPEVQYTKPILILINAMDFSCGDIFPAIMQDNQRAILMGSRTAGAGGSVTTTDFANHFGVMMVSYTETLLERVNSGTIENLGVSPDIPCEITTNDLQNNYVDYMESIHAVVNNMLQGE